MRFLFLFLLQIILIFPTLKAQEEEDPCVQKMSKQVEREFKKGRELQKEGKKKEAFKIYYEILEEYPDNLEVNYYLALGYYLPIELNGLLIENTQDAKNAIRVIQKMYDVCPFYNIQVHLYAARLSYLLENFDDAIKFATVIVENSDLIKKNTYVEEAEMIIKKSNFYQKILSNPVKFDPKPVVGISTHHDEYLATISPDDEYFYFTRRKTIKMQEAYFQENYVDREYFSYSKRNKNGHFEVGEPMPYPFNQDGNNEGSPTVNLRNDFLIFVKVTNVKINNQNYPNYDLYYSELIGGEWTEPANLGDSVNRIDSWESQPSLSSNGQLLFFASDRPGGFGGSDIWYTERGDGGKWRKPKNVGPMINTSRNERSPFLHTDSKTLYFSSAGHDGMGGMDIFYSKLGEKGWQKPVNIGYPINTEMDEVDFFVNLKGDIAYFSSNHIDGKDWNIYQFELHEEARPRNMLLIKGEIKDVEGDKIKAIVQIRDTASNIIAETKVNEYSGKYAIAAEIKKDGQEELILNVKNEGYAYDTRLITVEEIEKRIVTDDIDIEKIEKGKSYNLNNIYFATNKWDLTAKSRAIIDLFVEFLEDNPTIKVEIQGHTDDIGTEEDNQILSEKRAESVYRYIIEKKVSPQRLRYKGYGELMPIVPNSTEYGRAKNRRTVFLILDN
ncbi:MAG TPA: OmpA family protein [Bacteroidales bacterium]|nr:OmpA family protein [Bacteroidales bacterium]